MTGFFASIIDSSSRVVSDDRGTVSPAMLSAVCSEAPRRESSVHVYASSESVTCGAHERA
jgi:hypothetical protein